tara:strand:+ start:2456 stop:2677 length:222 start_codon:yes stop_codon:yes gene_type:complete
MKKEVFITLNGVELVINGIYYREEQENGLPERFEIGTITSNSDCIYDLLEYVSLRGMTYMQTIEDLCLQKINS